MSADMRMPIEGFHDPVAEWFAEALGPPTRAQQLGWPAIQRGESTLLLAPTGSGKTLAAFLVAIDRVMFGDVPPAGERCRVLYVSPLKALAVDIERNLRAPIEGITETAERMGVPFHVPTVSVRTGDTPGRERARFARRPTDILITTPESLFLMLTSNARETLRSVRWVIVDEIHAMVATKRGTHLALSLERLAGIARDPFQRIGLSATQRPLDEVARFLGGFQDDGAPRPVTIVDAGAAKALDLHVEMAIAGIGNQTEHRRERERQRWSQTDPAHVVRARKRPQMPFGDQPPTQHKVRAYAGETGGGEQGIWPAVHPIILAHIRAHRSTLIFVNNRRLAERLTGALNELAGEPIVQAHHGSIAREQRVAIEEALKRGRLPAIVATSTLELGIDMGAIDLVIQVESPPSVSAAMQRIGRAGHQIGAPSKGVIIPKYRGDLLSAATITERMRAGAVEEMRYPRSPLDVLAQQVVAMVSMDDWRVDDLERAVRRAAPYAELARPLLEGVLDMLSGRYPSHEFAELRPRITWDRAANTLTAREGARRVAVANGGTIPDRGLYGVFIAGQGKGQGRVGELEEVMVFESRVGDVFLLGASSWRIEDIQHDRVLVSPAPGVPGRMPFWHGENLGRPLELGRAMGALTRTLRDMPEPDAIALLRERHDLAPEAGRDLLDYLQRQADATGVVPDDRTIVVERGRDEMGDWRVCILTPFGSRVHAPWAMAIGAMLRDRTGAEPDILWTDNGIVVRVTDVDEPPPVEAMVPGAHEVEGLVVRQLGTGGGGARAAGFGAPVTALFASRFREAAQRALLMPHRKPGQRSPLWAQRKRAADLLHVVGRYPSFPLVLETYRECLRDVFDMPALQELLGQIERREVELVPVETVAPSPFASAILFSYVANFMYEGDAPLAERRAQALTVDPVQLRQLLGEVELRDLLDPEALAQLEARLQHLADDTGARHVDGLHDLLLRLGDLSDAEVRERCSSPDEAAGWLGDLEAAGRVVRIDLGGEARYVAVEDAARYRDALGAALPEGVPEAFLESADDPVADLVARYARTHGPFQATEAAQRWGTGVAVVTAGLRQLEGGGRVLHGEFRPGGSGLEWCDAGVLRALRQGSLARIRHEVEPVAQSALGRFALAWHGVGSPARGPGALLEAIRRLQGAAIPASVLETQVLPARVVDYDPRELDLLLASGQVLWMGAGALPPRDGRVRLLLADRAPYLLGSGPAAATDATGLGARLRAVLAERGACFFPHILRGVGGFPPDVLEALWEAVWDGVVTNDTLQPLREYLNPSRDRKAHEVARRRPGPLGRYRPLVGSGGVTNNRPVPPEAIGRWSLVRDMVLGEANVTQQAAAWTDQLLERHGVLTREAVAAEGMEGGFGAFYPVLKGLEDNGRVRRGYFVEGLGATQFALPEAVERLRSLREPPAEPVAVLLSAADPANPYGAALPWPEGDGDRRPGRAAGSSVVLVDGCLAAWLSRGGGSVLTFADHVPHLSSGAALEAVAACLAQAVTSGRMPGLVVEEVDGAPAARSPLAEHLEAAGFRATSRGYVKRRGA